ncbi:MAG: ABC transporter permease [Fimbriimonadaceae bacterium]
MLAQSFLIALEMLRLHKMRAFLTMLGVIIGVMAVTTIVMITNGFKAYMAGEFSTMGANTVYVFFDPGRLERETAGKIDGLTMEDAQYLRDRIPEIERISPYSEGGRTTALYGENKVSDASIKAIEENYCNQSDFILLSGRKILSADTDSLANVGIIGEELRNLLFKGADPLGKFVTLNGITVEVIGVLKKKAAFGQSNEKDIYLPITTFQKKLQGGDKVMMLTVEPKAGVEGKVIMDKIWEAMMARSGNKKIYRVDSSESMLAVFNGILGGIGVVLAGVAALSLLVGGIGIMNIMLVSVTERTREIGLRKAVGARGKNVMTQFLVEAGTLSLVGGLIGMALAYGLGSLATIISAANKFPNEGGLPTPFPITAAIGSAAFSAIIGMVFGFYPAVSAAKLDPIVALRRE